MRVSFGITCGRVHAGLFLLAESLKFFLECFEFFARAAEVVVCVFERVFERLDLFRKVGDRGIVYARARLVVESTCCRNVYGKVSNVLCECGSINALFVCFGERVIEFFF